MSSYVSSLTSDSSSNIYTSISTSGSITFSGLGNGTDFSEIIDATIEAESYTLEEYESEKSRNESIISLLESLSDSLDSLNTTLEEMDEWDEFLDMTATSTGDSVSASADGDALPGTHTVVVDQLAQADVWVDTGYAFSAEDTVLASSATSITLAYGGQDLTLSVAAGTTLAGLVSAINSSSVTNDKITASLIYDGGSYYLSLSGEDTGAANAIVIKDTGGLTGLDEDNFTNTRTAQDALLKVDGFPTEADQWIARDSNTIDDVITGMTLTLTGTTDSDGETLTVNYDTEAMVEKIESFLQGVNQIILDIQTLTGRLDTDYEDDSTVSTDTDDEDSDDSDDTVTLKSYALDWMYNEIKSILSSSGLGFARYDADTDSGDLITALSQLGISTDTEEGSETFGQLVLDSDTLEDVLSEDPAAVAAIFASKTLGESDSDNLQVISLVEGVTSAGEYDVSYTVENGVLTSATIGGKAAKVDGWTILGTDSTSSGLYLQVVDQSDGDHDGTVRVKQGKIAELSEAISKMTDSETGSLAIMVNNYEQGITNLDSQIYNESARLDALETYLTEKYARLDEMLSYYTNLESTLSSLVSSLSSSS